MKSVFSKKELDTPRRIWYDQDRRGSGCDRVAFPHHRKLNRSLSEDGDRLS